MANEAEYVSKIEALNHQLVHLTSQIRDRDKVIDDLQILINNLNAKVSNIEKSQPLVNTNTKTKKRKNDKIDTTTKSAMQLVKQRKTGATQSISKFFLKDFGNGKVNQGASTSNSENNNTEQRMESDTEMCDLTNTTNIDKQNTDGNVAQTPNNTDGENNDNSNNEDNGGEWQFVSHRNKKNGAEKIQPIQMDIETEAISTLKETLESEVGINAFTINQLKSQKSIRIYANSIESRQTIIELLKQTNYDFHSYLQKDEKRHCYIIKGLNGYDNTDIVKNELIRAGLPDDTAVLFHITGYQRANPNAKHNTLFKVIVNSTIDEKEIIKIKSLFGYMIKIENLKPKKVTQMFQLPGIFSYGRRLL